MPLNQWQLAQPAEPVVNDIVASCGLSRPIALVLAGRGVAVNEIPEFLNPRLAGLSDPYLLPGIEQAAARLWQAIQADERVLVHGDYDADGVTATVLLTWALQECGAAVDSFVPHRVRDGYGFTVDSLDQAVSDHRVLVTVDCGITSHDAAQAAKDRGLDVIITDHHEPAETTPAAFAVVNPKLHRDNPGLQSLQGLAGVGVAFKLAHALIKYGRQHDLGGHTTDLREGMDLVAMGTVADVVPLLGENRCLVRHGLGVIGGQRRPGMRALCDVAGVSGAVQCADIAFRLAPRLNAAGRVDDAREAVALLQSRSLTDAYSVAERLNACNDQRREWEQQALAAAQAQLTDVDVASHHSVVVCGENWHPGVIGIVASRLMRQYNRPTLVLTAAEDGLAQGSGRSVAGVDLITVLRACRSRLLDFGGHAMASGLRLELSELTGLRENFEAAVRDIAAFDPAAKPVLAVDGDVAISELNDQFFSELDALRPFGQAHDAPAFRLRHIQPDRVSPAGQRHCRGILRDSSGARMSFILFNRRADELPRQPWNIVARPEMNRYRGSLTPQLQLLDLEEVS
jgi:single-stranded-DNA-specific exonuclease